MKTGAAPGAGAVWDFVVASWPMATAAARTRARAIATSTAPIWRVPSGCWTVRVEADIGPSWGVRPGSELFGAFGTGLLRCPHTRFDQAHRHRAPAPTGGPWLPQSLSADTPRCLIDGRDRRRSGLSISCG